MENNKVLIGAGVLVAIGAAVYFWKRGQNAEAAAAQQQADATAAAAAQSQAEQRAQVETVKKQNAAILKKYPAGTLLKVKGTDSVYQISDLGERRWITTRKVFDALHLNMADVKQITAIEMNSIPIGPAIASVPKPDLSGANIMHLLVA